MNIKTFTAARLAPILTRLVARDASGEIDRKHLNAFCHLMLKDGRESVACLVARYYPLPVAGVDDVDTLLGKELLAALPGLYSQRLSKEGIKQRAFKASLAAKELMEATDPLLEYEEGTRRMRDKYPAWSALLFNPSPAVACIAISRIPRAGNPLSLLLPLLTTSQHRSVREQARLQLGLLKGVSYSRYQRREVPAVDAAALAAEQNEDGAIASFFEDSRTSVRFAAALRLPVDSPLWPVVAEDASPRVRKLAVQRLPLEALPAMRADEHASVRRAVALRLGEAEDSGGQRAAVALKSKYIATPLAERQSFWESAMEGDEAP